MKSTFRILFYVKKDKQKANGNYPIMCRITIDGEAARFNTKVDQRAENDILFSFKYSAPRKNIDDCDNLP